MEKTITYSQQEIAQMQQIEQKRINILAQVGALMLDLETARKALETCNEERSMYIRSIVAANGVQSFESARPTKEGIVVTVPESMGRPNGSEALQA